MFINSIKRECEICGCEKNQHSNERCLSCLADTKKRTNKQHEYVDSSSTLDCDQTVPCSVTHTASNPTFLASVTNSRGDNPLSDDPQLV